MKRQRVEPAVLLRHLAVVVLVEWQRHVDVSSELFRPADIQRSLGDPSKAARLLGWEAGYRMADVVRLMALS